MIEERLLARITQLKSTLDAARPLPKGIVHKLKEQLDVEWTYNSNAIEGSTLTLRETQLILEQGITIGGKNLREHFEVINHKGAIDFVQQLADAQRKTPITAHVIRQLHQLVLTQIDDDHAGQYRQVAVRIAGATHIPPEPWDVPATMDTLIGWVRSAAAKKMHPIERAAITHHRFVAIHPFVDGNGRTGRLLLNLLLMQDGYPPAIIERVNRQQYYAVLKDADQGHDQRLVNFVARACEKSLRLYVEAGIANTRRPAIADQWISLAEAAQGSPYSQEYLSLLARTGKLMAKKRGRNWLTTRAAIAEYQANRLK